MSEETIEFEIKPGEGAIVFSEDGIKIITHTSFDSMPIHVRETIEFVTYALLKPDWISEFHDYLATAEAIMDLMGEKHEEKPRLTLIQGGKKDEDE